MVAGRWFLFEKWVIEYTRALQQVQNEHGRKEAQVLTTKPRLPSTAH